MHGETMKPVNIVVYTVILLYLYFTSCYVRDTLYFVTLTQDNV